MSDDANLMVHSRKEPKSVKVFKGKPTWPQTPQSQHSGSWPQPLTHTAHASFQAVHFRCTPGPPHLPPDATIAAF